MLLIYSFISGYALPFVNLCGVSSNNFYGIGIVISIRHCIHGKHHRSHRQLYTTIRTGERLVCRLLSYHWLFSVFGRLDNRFHFYIAIFCNLVMVFSDSLGASIKTPAPLIHLCRFEIVVKVFLCNIPHICMVLWITGNIPLFKFLI
jgi:hypothetical protein